MIQSGGIRARSLCVDAKLAVHLRQELRRVPLPRMLLLGAIGVHQLAGDVFRNPQHVVSLVFAFQRRAANGVDRLALLVHYVVVFQQMFARVEVLRFHGLLRILNAAGDHPRLDGHAFRHP